MNRARISFLAVAALCFGPLATHALAVAALCFGLLATPVLADEDLGWPREIASSKAKILIYQPQVETFKGDTLTGRAAVSVTPNAKPEPIFGVFWFSCRVTTDRDARTVDIAEITVTKVRVPGATDDQQVEFRALVESQAPGWDLTLSLDRLLASLEAAQVEMKSAENLNNTPPRILFSTEPAALILIDGEPALRPVENTDLARVVNTPSLIVQENGAATFYLYGDTFWYSASSPKGPFTSGANPPSSIRNLLEQVQSAGKEAGTKPDEAPAKPPRVIVATEPTELIVFDGPPNYVPITGTTLLYASNTEDDLFKELDSQKFFILISGRWFASKSLEGPWEYIRSDKLPATFQRIPPSSARADVLPMVAGTIQAENAVADAQIPQTSAVKRGEVKIDVVYDGEPRFEPAGSSGVEYAVNTGFQVLKIKDTYYVCKEAVWYVGPTPKGPWTVSETRPEAVDSIPPESPVYNTKYVYVYDSTPSVVYVGYLPGYVGCYPYYGTVVYGTGWYYPPYIGPVYYYPRPVTWGFSVRYSPYYGWSYGIGFSNGFISVGISFGGYYGYPAGGYWGPAGYRPPVYYPGYRPGYPGYRPGYPGNRPGYPGYRPPGGASTLPAPGAGAGNRPSTLPSGGTAGAGNRPSTLPSTGGAGAGNRPGTLPAGGGAAAGAAARPGTQPATQPGRDNLYNRPGNVENRASGAQTRDLQQPKAARGATNNVYAGRDGNVYRNDGGQWQSRDGNGWSNGAGGAGKAGSGNKAGAGGTGAGAGTRPSQGSGTGGGRAPSDVQRDASARQRGTQGTQGYQGSQSGSSRSAGGGRPSGGGGRPSGGGRPRRG